MEKLREFKIIYFGSGNFAIKVFVSLVEKNLKPCCLVTIPDKPYGRGRQKRSPRICDFARQANVEVFQPLDPNHPSFIERLKSYEPDIILLADYGKILARDLLDFPKYGALNIHPSLLPKYRGCAPLERAIMNGEKETGFTLFLMDEGIDTGPILFQKEVPIQEETRGELETKIAKLSVEELPYILEKWLSGELKPKNQEGPGSYSKKIEDSELWIDWKESAVSVRNKVHALSPTPGARTHIDGRYTKIYRAHLLEDVNGHPGQIKVENGRLIVICGKGAVEVLELQPSGKKIISAKEYISGYNPIWAE